MRISDWSSDVCSSDLLVLLRIAFIVDVLHDGVEVERQGVARPPAERDATALDDGIVDVVGAGKDVVGPAGCPPVHAIDADGELVADDRRSEEHTSELQSLMRISYAVFCLKKKKNTS